MFLDSVHDAHAHVSDCDHFLWPPYVIGADIIFLPCDFYLVLSSFFFFLA